MFSYMRIGDEWKTFSRGLGCPQQAKRAAAGGGAVIGISVKDIPIDCLQKRPYCTDKGDKSYMEYRMERQG